MVNLSNNICAIFSSNSNNTGNSSHGRLKMVGTGKNVNESINSMQSFKLF